MEKTFVVSYVYREGNAVPTNKIVGTYDNKKDAITALGETAKKLKADMCLKKADKEFCVNQKSYFYLSDANKTSTAEGTIAECEMNKTYLDEDNDLVEE